VCVSEEALHIAGSGNKDRKCAVIVPQMAWLFSKAGGKCQRREFQLFVQ
jgi:hypothetical protein